jgi:cellulose synthase/poly-beta-1,6-N-acetylglucosamine synthase-like glycosyltransferase
LRRQKLITLEGGTLTIQDLDALKEVSFFNPDYLHLDYSNENSHDNEREAN